MKKIFLLFCISTLLSSCEKDIDFETQKQEAVLVVDGIIEDGKMPQIVLTKSLDYFANITPQIALNSFARNAIVSISNGSTTHILKEYEQNLGLGYKAFYYSIDSSNPSTAFVGEQGKTYTLKINFENKEYQSTTTIPILTKTCDSLWWKKDDNIKDCDTCVIMTGKFTDPPLLGNYIRYFTKVNSEPFFAGEKSAFDDQVVNGTTYNAEINKSLDRNLPNNKDNKYPYPTSFLKGDTITLKLCNTDKATYNFWNTWEFAYQAIGNPFSTPTKVISNISNNALGAFCGYSVQYKTLIIPK